MKERTLDGFGIRLTTMRKLRGMTQMELGAAVGVSNRVVAYYEQEAAQPPGAMLVDLAGALGVTTDALLGVEPVPGGVTGPSVRVLKRLERIAELHPGDQKAILRIIDGFIESRDPHRRGKAA